MKDNAKKPATKQFEDSTPLLSDPKKLRAKAKKEGYLFFRALLDADKLLQVRLQILELLQKRNLLDRNYPIMEGIAEPNAVNSLPDDSVRGFGVPADLYREVQKLEAFHALAHEPAILEVYRALFETEVFPHPRNIARIMLPHNSVTATPPHQDFLHIQGTQLTWTAWFPLGDCPRELGGLSVLEGSHDCGLLTVTGHEGAGGLETILCDLDLDWAETDYQLGDLLIFHSHTVHKALPNQLGNQIRLSCDFRYQPANQKIDHSSMYPHGGKGYFEWDDLYQGWSNKDIQYYWQKFNLEFSEWDESIRWQKEKIC